ncbi:general stress protein [Jeotgalibaca sp. MA1X17-3]|uniref:general stress protein n=1 Tax=Jeotgalibaca sp. MA1X17-3 TaxID=2908211 RepID=UPI001F35BA3A|nr:general stress protein [Jeotgalibaca sp. MA1X17-3]UJF16219.1 general stress protein [Jeotgalibaca sp. MA1X17-3]
MNKRVEGSYSKIEEAMQAVQKLREKGYLKEDIYVVANSTVKDSIPLTMDAEVSTDTNMRDNIDDNERSFWDKIKDAFTIDDYEEDQVNHPNYDTEEDPLHPYHEQIKKGNIVVLTDKNAKPSVAEEDTNTDVLDSGMKTRNPVTELGSVETDPEMVGYKTDTLLRDEKTFVDVPGTNTDIKEETEKELATDSHANDIDGLSPELNDPIDRKEIKRIDK